MSNLSDFLEENEISPQTLVARSNSLESRGNEDRQLDVKRASARRAKKTYQELSLDKPAPLGRGVSLRTVTDALEGRKIPRLGRKKITRAVNAILTSKGNDEVDFRALFADVGSRKGKRQISNPPVPNSNDRLRYGRRRLPCLPAPAHSHFMGDDRPKRSWREIDQAREKGRTRRDDRGSSGQNTSSYSRYKSQLDQLFKPGGAQLPEHIRSQMGPQDDSAKERRALLDALRAEPSEKTLSAYVEGEHPLPEEPRFLMSLLAIRDEALIRPVLSRLLDVVESGKRPNRMLLIQRIEAVQSFAEEEDTVELLRTLRAALD